MSGDSDGEIRNEKFGVIYYITKGMLFTAGNYAQAIQYYDKDNDIMI
jgi:hypothetical protein